MEQITKAALLTILSTMNFGHTRTGQNPRCLALKKKKKERQQQKATVTPILEGLNSVYSKNVLVFPYNNGF